MWNLFEDKLVEEVRDPIWLFQAGHFNVGIFPPKPAFIFQVLSLIFFQIVISNLLSLVAYYGIVRSKSRETALLLGFGVLIPLALWIPFAMIDFFDIRSTALRMGLVPLPFCVPLRTLQAMFQNTPSVFTTSWNDYRRHFGFILHPRLDPSTQHPITWTVSSFVSAVLQHVVWMLILGVAFSFLVPHSFEPLEAPRKSHEIFLSFHPGHIVNNFIGAVLCSMSLSLSMSGVGALVQILSGLQVESVVEAPMFLSESPSDFWGKRWNRLIHTDLKNGVYKPMRSMFSSRGLATLVTFVTSGVMHEYVWLLLFYVSKHQNAEDCYVPPFGKSLLFFGWNGILLLFEYAVGKELWMQMTKQLPQAVITLSVLLMALPVGHLFTGDMVRGGYNETLRFCLPLVVVERLA